MKVASLELCRELSEVSEWADTTFFRVKTYIFDSANVIWQLEEPSIGETFTEGIPAYDLGYLRQAIMAGLAAGIQQEAEYEYILWYERLAHALIEGEDQTAELAIEMFKQEILTK